MHPSDDDLPEPIDDRRREFLRIGAAAGVTAALAHLGASELHALTDPAPAPLAAPPMEKVRIGFVGVGGMGMVHVENLVHIPGAEIRAALGPLGSPRGETLSCKRTSIRCVLATFARSWCELNPWPPHR
jgi:hypothetical protein